MTPSKPKRSKTLASFEEFCSGKVSKPAVTRVKHTGKNGLDKPKLQADAVEKVTMLKSELKKRFPEVEIRKAPAAKWWIPGTPGSTAKLEKAIRAVQRTKPNPVSPKRQARAGSMLAWHLAVNKRDDHKCQGCQVLPGFSVHASAKHGEHLQEQGKASALRLELGNGAAACAFFNSEKNRKSRKGGRIRGWAMPLPGTGVPGLNPGEVISQWRQWYWTPDKCVTRWVHGRNTGPWVTVAAPSKANGWALVNHKNEPIAYTKGR